MYYKYIYILINNNVYNYMIFTILSGITSKLVWFKTFVVSLTSLSIGFISYTVWPSTFPNSVLKTGNLTGEGSSEFKLRSYQISPNYSFIKATEPDYLPTNIGEKSSS